MCSVSRGEGSILNPCFSSVLNFARGRSITQNLRGECEMKVRNTVASCWSAVLKHV